MKLFSVKEAAGFMGVHEMTVRKWIYSGRIRAYRAGKLIRIKEEDLMGFLESSEPQNI
jgi:excisionase family DNA binding protein